MAVDPAPWQPIQQAHSARSASDGCGPRLSSTAETRPFTLSLPCRWRTSEGGLPASNRGRRRTTLGQWDHRGRAASRSRAPNGGFWQGTPFCCAGQRQEGTPASGRRACRLPRIGDDQSHADPDCAERFPTKTAPVGPSRARANAVRNFVLECTRRRIVVRSPTYEPDKTQAASASSDAPDWRACLSCRLAIASLCNPNIDMPSTIEVLTGFHADIKMGGDTRTMRARAMAGSTEAWEFCGNRSSARLFQSAFWVESGFMA